MSSYHALLGCVVAGMGIALVPKSVLPTFPGRKYLNTYPMAKEQSKVDVWLAWRKEMHSARVQALADTLLASVKKAKRART
jgi:DNA-binding transcriptional LysR family regulator